MTQAPTPIPPRPFHERRAAYRAVHPQEMFIVPVVKQAIEEALAQHGSPPYSGARALDIGCGRQPFRGALQKLGYAYTGMDVEQNQESNVEHFGPIDQPLPASLVGQTFELLFVTEVLEHVADWNAAFNNLSRLLAPGGILIITAPFVYPLHELPYDFWRPTLHAITFFAHRQGFQTIETRSVGTQADVLGTVLAATTIMPASSSLLSRLNSKCLNLIRRIALRRLHQKHWTSRVRFEGEMYLSNITIFRNPKAV